MWPRETLPFGLVESPGSLCPRLAQEGVPGQASSPLEEPPAVFFFLSHLLRWPGVLLKRE